MTCEAVTCGNSTVITMCTMQHIIQSSTCVQINAIKDAALNTLKQEIQHCLHTFMQNLGTECNRTIWLLKTRVDIRDLQDSCLDIDRSTKNTFGTLLQSWVSSRNVSMQLSTTPLSPNEQCVSLLGPNTPWAKWEADETGVLQFQRDERTVETVETPSLGSQKCQFSEVWRQVHFLGCKGSPAGGLPGHIIT